MYVILKTVDFSYSNKIMIPTFLTSLLMWFYNVVTINIIVTVFKINCALLILWIAISWSHNHTDIGNGDGHMCTGNCRELV